MIKLCFDPKAQSEVFFVLIANIFQRLKILDPKLSRMVKKNDLKLKKRQIQ